MHSFTSKLHRNPIILEENTPMKYPWKTRLKPFTCLLLALALTLSVPAAASQALGWELHKSVTVLGDGVTVTDQILWGDSISDYRREKYLTYQPGVNVTPMVVYGAKVPTKATLTAMARGLEDYGYRVLGGANGDYFVMSTGVPLGMVVTWGVLRSSSSYQYAVGFRSDGTAFVGKPDMQIWAELGGTKLLVAGGYNKSRTADGGYTLFNSDFGTSTGANATGVNVVLRPVTVPEGYTVPPPVAQTDPETGEELPITQADYDAALAYAAQGLSSLPAQLTVGGKVTCVVEKVTTGAKSVQIPEGRFVLSIDDRGPDYQRALASWLKQGEQVKISVTCADERWQSAVSAIGAYLPLLSGGEVCSGLDTTANPRTALGIKEDGQVILYTIDGRSKGHSLGASMTQVAKRLKELGCVDAVLFDGGGSTTFGTTGAMDGVFTLDNVPSDGAQRAVTNALFFVSNLKPTGVAGSLYVTPHDGVLLSGARVELSASAIDTGFYPMYALGGGVSYTAQGPGTVEGSILTAGAEKGEVVVTASAGGDVTGEALFTVIPTPDAIALKNQSTGKAVTSLTLEPWEKVDLTAAATWYKLPLQSQDDCFTWACDPSLGIIDSYGYFSAGSKGGSGAITVSAGDKTVSIPVTIPARAHLLEDCEGDLWAFGNDTAAAGPETETVRTGFQSLKVTYPTDGKPSRLDVELPIPFGESYLGVWMYADGSETRVDATFRLTDGSTAAATLSKGGFTGWKKVLAELPEGVEALTGLTITPAWGGTGTLYFDQFFSANAAVYDGQGPTVDLIVGNGKITATLKDNVDKDFLPQQVSLTVDGVETPFTLTGHTLTAELPERQGALQRVSLTVSDASGNLTRASWQGEAAGAYTDPFGDTQDHWAEPYASYLYAHGIATGSVENGVLSYRPGDNITRTEFAALLCRWLGLDVSQYADVVLPFSDWQDIPTWGYGNLQALYAKGVFAGSAEGGTLYAHPTASITRAEAITMLGRVLAKGFAQSGNQFADHDQIPSWAQEAVYTLARLGVVSGYEGMVRPGDPITRGEAAKLFTTMW